MIKWYGRRVPKNRIVLITGATRGIGFSAAADFLEGGDKVVIFCRQKGHVMKAAGQFAWHGERENILEKRKSGQSLAADS
jgi:NAD(P)-dependent dehydrogenase (short-subunit alcohol dehydrogenase family)